MLREKDQRKTRTEADFETIEGRPLHWQVEAGGFLEKVGGSKKEQTGGIFWWQIVGSNPPPKRREFVIKRCVLRAVNASKCVCGRRSAPDPAGGAHSVPHRLLSWPEVRFPVCRLRVKSRFIDQAR